MTAFPVTDWQASLDEMETALGNTLAALDRYQAGWERLLSDESVPARPSAEQLEVQMREWDARLIAAAELAESVERELHDRQSAVAGWKDSLNAWRSGLK